MSTDIVYEQLLRYLPRDYWVTSSVQFHAPKSGDQPIPDVSVIPKAALEGDELYVPLDIAALVVEVGSPSTSRDDRQDKRVLYASEGVLLYLFVDRLKGRVDLFSGPVDGDYLSRTSALYGDKLTIPEPFGFDLDTSELPPYVRR